jgi:hypothetical protein
MSAPRSGAVAAHQVPHRVKSLVRARPANTLELARILVGDPEAIPIRPGQPFAGLRTI